MAWSTFITGLDPGGHGIFDFIHRDPKTMVPYLSTSRTEGSSRAITVGEWQFPLSGGSVELLRQGQPFWEVLEAARYRNDDHPHAGKLSSVGHRHARVERHGHAGPPRDLRDVFVLHIGAVRVRRPGACRAGPCIRSRSRATSCAPRCTVPTIRFARCPRKSRADFTLLHRRRAAVAKLVVGDEERVLAVGEWSDWVPVDFDLRVPLQSVRGMAGST